MWCLERKSLISCRCYCLCQRFPVYVIFAARNRRVLNLVILNWVVWCFYSLNIFFLFFTVSFVDFERINICWAFTWLPLVILVFFYLQLNEVMPVAVLSNHTYEIIDDQYYMWWGLTLYLILKVSFSNVPSANWNTTLSVALGNGLAICSVLLMPTSRNEQLIQKIFVLKSQCAKF